MGQDGECARGRASGLQIDASKLAHVRRVDVITYGERLDEQRALLRDHGVLVRAVLSGSGTICGDPRSLVLPVGMGDVAFSPCVVRSTGQTRAFTEPEAFQRAPRQNQSSTTTVAPQMRQRDAQPP